MDLKRSENVFVGRAYDGGSADHLLKRYSSIRKPQMINSDMQSPSGSNKNTRLPPSVTVVEVNNQVKLPSDTFSQLSQALSGAKTTLSLPLCAANIGIPKTPPQCLITPVDEALIEQGYDSDGRRPPWEEAEGLDFDGPELDK